MNHLAGIVDKIEGEFFVIEIDGITVDVPKAEVDSKVKSGDYVEKVEGKWVTNVTLTSDRTKKISKLIDDVWGD
jgi:hypothetical protein